MLATSACKWDSTFLKWEVKQACSCCHKVIEVLFCLQGEFCSKGSRNLFQLSPLMFSLGGSVESLLLLIDKPLSRGLLITQVEVNNFSNRPPDLSWSLSPRSHLW